MDPRLPAKKRFFKIMLPGFHETLNLPQALCKNVTREKSEHQATLKTLIGMWEIQVCRNQEGLISFKNGWSDFLRCHGLSVGDLVVFEHTGNFQFNATVFDTSACEKEFIANPEKLPKKVINPTNDNHHLHKKLKRELILDKNFEAAGITYQSKNPFFVRAMKHYCAKNASVSIPQAFWKTNLRRKSVILRGPNGRECKVELTIRKSGGFRCVLGGGWAKFYGDNKLKDGDVCVFELEKKPVRSAKAVIDVHVHPVPTIQF